MVAELKPCPFCGNDTANEYSGSSSGEWFVRCDYCWAQGPYSTKSRQMAIASWNERKGETADIRCCEE